MDLWEIIIFLETTKTFFKTVNIIIFRCDLLRDLGIHEFLSLRSVANTMRRRHDAGRG